MNGVASTPLISSTDFVAPDTSARWAPVASLPAGQSITVYMCAKVTTSTANATVRNKANVTWTGGSAEAQALQVVGAKISGTVYEDPNTSGFPSGAGDTPIPGVTVTLWKDVNEDGKLDGGDTEIKSTVTGPDGYYEIGGVDPTIKYLVSRPIRLVSLAPMIRITIHPLPMGWMQ